uniref:Uncharacterized protein n=1 Tax=viral metagenome TaxID=1070528 RepID=A0A6C0JLC1_9ZZZZ
MDFALPSRALPSRALQLINDYSKPVTRPNWRHSKPIITIYRLYERILLYNDYSFKNKYKQLYQRTLWSIADTEWYFTYEFIRFYGLNYYLEKGGKYNLNDDGIQYAIDYYIKYRMM